MRGEDVAGLLERLTLSQILMMWESMLSTWLSPVIILLGVGGWV
jgi:hypothetical protein